ncbi:MAG TPA: L-threonylcarbamoyladenylate synthase [Actinomycetota bacterium]|nr:L-threonylcarbamoyladenylate synthase [Actinomycetota bacterium]
MLEEGGVAVIPTDTVYGLAARLDRPKAVDKIFKLKGRPRSKPLPILVPDIRTARTLGEFDKDALEMAMKSWPGAVTIVVRSTEDVPDIKTARTLGEFDKDALEMAMKSWPGAVTIVVRTTEDVPDIGGDGTTVGLRIPSHPFTLELLRDCGPLVATSANPSGNPTGAVLQEVLLDLGNGPGIYVDGGTLNAPPSTVISMLGEPRILR